MPRLHRSSAAAIWDSRQGHTVADLFESADTENSLQVFTSTGGTQITDAELSRLADQIRSRARTSGYPGTDKKEYRKFDIWAATWFADNWPGHIGEALRSDTWAFLTTVLLPDVVVWRWPNRTPDRLYGALTRNALGRLWLHGSMLSRSDRHGWNNRWELLLHASEDFLMNLVERPSLSADRSFAVSVAEEWLRWRNKLASGEVEQLHRSALKRLRLLTTTVEITVLDATQRTELITEAFRLSYEAMHSVE